jgi:hypothetical protein
MSRDIDRLSYEEKTKKYQMKCADLIDRLTTAGHSVKIAPWFDNLISDINRVYSPDYIITGSAAVAIYLHHYNKLTDGALNCLFELLPRPNDVDFVYVCKGTAYIPTKKIGNYTRVQEASQRSVTYRFNESVPIKPLIISSFDLTCVASVKYSVVDRKKIISLAKLKDYYKGDIDGVFDDDKINEIKRKIFIIEQLIDTINNRLMPNNIFELPSREEPSGNIYSPVAARNLFDTPPRKPFGTPPRESLDTVAINLFGTPTTEPVSTPPRESFGTPTKDPFGTPTRKSFGTP